MSLFFEQFDKKNPGDVRRNTHPSTFGYGSFHDTVHVAIRNPVRIKTLFRHVRDDMSGQGTRIKRKTDDLISTVDVKADVSGVSKSKYWRRYLGDYQKIVNYGNDVRFADGAHMVLCASYYTFLRRKEVPVEAAVDALFAMLFFEANAPGEHADWNEYRYSYANAISPFSLELASGYFRDFVDAGDDSIENLSTVGRVLDMIVYIASGFIWQSYEPIPPEKVLGVADIRLSDVSWDENWYMERTDDLLAFVSSVADGFVDLVGELPITHLRGRSVDWFSTADWFSIPYHNNGSFVVGNTLYSFSDTRRGFVEKQDFVYNSTIKMTNNLDVNRQAVICFRTLTARYIDDYGERLPDLESLVLHVYSKYHESWSSGIFTDSHISPMELLKYTTTDKTDVFMAMEQIHMICPDIPSAYMAFDVDGLVAVSEQDEYKYDFYGLRRLRRDPLLKTLQMLYLGALLEKSGFDFKYAKVYDNVLFSKTTGTIHAFLPTYNENPRFWYEVPHEIDGTSVRIVGRGAFRFVTDTRITFSHKCCDLILDDGVFEGATDIIRDVDLTNVSKVGSRLFGGVDSNISQPNVRFKIPHDMKDIPLDFAYGSQPHITIISYATKDTSSLLNYLRSR